MAAVRVAEGTLALACLRLVAKRYQRKRIRIVPGDMLLWTLLIFFVAHLVISAVGIAAPYRLYPALGDAFADPLARLFAAIGVFLAVIATTTGIRAAERREARSPAPTIAPMRRRLWLGLAFLPLILVWLAPKPSVYRTFAAAFVLRTPGEPFADPLSAASQFHIVMTWTTYLSCVAFAVWLALHKTRAKWTWAVGGAVCFMDFWLNGKRHIVAMFVMVAVFALLGGRDFTPRQVRRGAWLGACSLALVLGLSSWYQTNYRPHLREKGQEMETLLVDYGRLDLLRFAVAGQITPGVPRPLSYPTQSAFLHFAALSGEDQQVSYADRVTSLAERRHVQARFGSLSTSLLSEAVDSFGPLGLLVGPMLLAGMGVGASFQNDPRLRIVGALAVSMLAVVHVLAVLGLVLLAGALLLPRIVRSALPRASRMVCRT